MKKADKRKSTNYAAIIDNVGLAIVVITCAALFFLGASKLIRMEEHYRVCKKECMYQQKAYNGYEICGDTLKCECLKVE